MRRRHVPKHEVRVQRTAFKHRAWGGALGELSRKQAHPVTASTQCQLSLNAITAHHIPIFHPQATAYPNISL